MALGIRGSNPIWTEFNLQGLLFDDTYYMYVLENTIPYIPAVVYHDPDLNTPWTSPIQFLGNGTLPIDIFFETDTVYRLEFRQNNGINPPSQSDPLIYEVTDYIPGTGGSSPVDTVALASGNQITNPQFSLINFSSPFTLSGTNPQPVDVGPGWFLDLTGTGTATITRVALNNSNINPSNAPYALQLTLNGWTTATLRQRFQQNGMLWASSGAVVKYVSSTITARIQGVPQSISAGLVDSNGTPLTSVLDATSVSGAWNEFTGYGQMPATTNPNTPPAAYIDYRLELPVNVDIYVTSFQLIVQDLPIEPSFEQDSIERQVDHTWHYYRDSVLFMPKSTILTGWNFPLNPWQFRTKANTTIVANNYITDQTILSMQNPGSIAVSSNSAGELALTTVAATTQQNFAVIQYIDPSTIVPYWNSLLSSLVTAALTTTNGTLLNIKMKLISSTTLPTPVDPIASWAANEPVFTAQWTAINAINSPVNVVSSGTLADFAFNGFQLPAISATTMTLGVVFYTTSALGDTDILRLKNISLVPNSFAIASQPQTYDQVLQECQFYYEKSYAQGVIPGTINAGGPLQAQQSYLTNGGNDSILVRAFGFPFKNICRTANPTIHLYSPLSGTIDNVRVQLYNCSSTATISVDQPTTAWVELQKSSTAVGFEALLNAPIGSIAHGAGTPNIDSFMYYHYTRDGRLGIIA